MSIIVVSKFISNHLCHEMKFFLCSVITVLQVCKQDQQYSNRSIIEISKTIQKPRKISRWNSVRFPTSNLHMRIEKFGKSLRIRIISDFSNVLLTSRKIAGANFFSSSADGTTLTLWLICSAVECLAQNPNWTSGSRFFSLTTVRSLLLTIYSKIFGITVSNEIG